MANKDKSELNIKVDFHEVIAGWIHFKIIAGEQSYDGRFSEVYDPIIDLKHWLEAVSTNVQQTSFTFDPEGDDIKFEINRLEYEGNYFVISEPYADGKTYLNVIVNRKQLVKAFYQGIIELSQSEKYHPREWEVCYYKQRLCGDYKVDEAKLLEILKQLKRKELIEKLFEANPMYLIDNKNRESEDPFSGDGTPMKMKISKKYDNWTDKTKEKFIVEIMNLEVSGFCGTKLSEFQSDIIEKYLSEK